MSLPETFQLTAADGLVLHGFSWAPTAPPRALIQLAHGMAEHALRYSHVAEALCAAGYFVVASDHRGHGKSIRPGEAVGHFADEGGWAKAVADLYLINRHFAAQHPGLPIAVLGHSMGSFLVQNLNFLHPDCMDATVLVASNGKPQPIAQAGRLVARVERARLGKRGRSTLLNKLSFEDFNAKFKPNRTPFDWVSRDTKQVDAYVADPLCGFMVTVQTWIDLLDALPMLTKPENLARLPKARPILVFSGDRDPVGLMGKGAKSLVESFRAAGLSKVEFKLYPGARHEILNETNREEVLADLVAWLDRALSKA